MTARTTMLREFTAGPPLGVRAEGLRTRFLLAALATGGTALYAFSAAPFLPALPAWEWITLLVIATGGAWIVFGLGAVLWLSLPARTVARASLFTMAAGELVLLATATGNLLLLRFGVDPGLVPAVLNLGGLMASDAVMAMAMGRFLADSGIGALRLAVLWVVVLHGTAITLALAAGAFFQL
jgi:hypothetical protein